MSFGIGDLFSILSGGAWLAKEAAKEAAEKKDDITCAERRRRFIAEHTDLELEEKLKKEIEDPREYESVWQRIEAFKRENCEFCDMHSNEHERFGWAQVGTQRLAFRDKKGGLYGKSLYEETQLKGNRNIALYLLMQTYGKMKLSHAEAVAGRMFPLKESNRSW